MEDRIVKAEKCLVAFLSGAFRFFIDIIYLIIDLIKVFGAIAALFLLAKLFPELAIPLFNAISKVSHIFINIITINVTLMGVTVGMLIGVWAWKLLEQIKQNNIQRREQFLNDLAKKIKGKK